MKDYNKQIVIFCISHIFLYTLVNNSVDFLEHYKNWGEYSMN